MDPAYFDRLAADYAAKRQMMCNALEEAGFDVPWPQGAYYVLADFSPLRERFDGFTDDAQAARSLVDRSGIGAVAGRAFFTDSRDGRDLLRFCYAKKFHELEEACSRLRQAFA